VARLYEVLNLRQGEHAGGFICPHFGVGDGSAPQADDKWQFDSAVCMSKHHVSVRSFLSQ
jgi:hypothetical protein